MKRFLKRLFLLAFLLGFFYSGYMFLGGLVNRYIEPLPAAQLPTASLLYESFEKAPDIKAEAAVVTDVPGGKILFSKNDKEVLYPASLTKLMTALLAAEKADWEDLVTIGDEMRFVGYNSSVAGLQVGDRMTVEELVWGAMLPSGNDAAYALAAHVGRLQAGHSVDAATAIDIFIEMMNAKAKELGTVVTNFTNPDGYHDPMHMSCAYDLALIAREVYRNPRLFAVVSAAEHAAQIRRGDGLVARTWRNTNQLLHKTSSEYYRWADGLKTGSTPQAGQCLAATARKNGRQLLVIILNSDVAGRYSDATALLDYVFERGW